MDQLSQGILEQAQDFMCCPQLVNDPFRLSRETYAQDLRNHIEFVLSHPKLIDPMDPTTIY